MKTPLLLLLAILSPVGVALAQAPVHSPPHPPRAHSPHSADRAHSASPQFSPVGIYDLEFDMHGQPGSAVLTITRDHHGTLKGTLEVHGQSIGFETVKVEDRVVWLANESEFSLTLNFKNDKELTGKWVRPEGGGALTGTRRKQT